MRDRYIHATARCRPIPASIDKCRSRWNGNNIFAAIETFRAFSRSRDPAFASREGLKRAHLLRKCFGSLAVANHGILSSRLLGHSNINVTGSTYADQVPPVIG